MAIALIWWRLYRCIVLFSLKFIMHGLLYLVDGKLFYGCMCKANTLFVISFILL